MKTIPLTRGKVALVDDADYEALLAYSWHAKPSWAGVWYAAAPVPRRTDAPLPRNRRYRIVPMHRMILGAPDSSQVDHVDGDGLNNQRSNLRLCSASQNCCNRPSRTRHGYRGVYAGRAGKWLAQVRASGRLIHIGTFATKEAAARAYDVVAKEHHGAFARLNFPAAENLDRCPPTQCDAFSAEIREMAESDA